jgi:hypothetical protein
VSTHLNQRLLERVRAEYREMPGLRLKADQVQRLCGIEPKICEVLLDALVKEHVLQVTPDGRYARLTEGPVPQAQPAKAEIRTDQRSRHAS